mgnify:FL=1
MPLSTKATALVATLKERAATFGKQDDAKSRAASLTVKSSRLYVVERAALTELAQLKPEACTAFMKAALSKPTSKYSNLLLEDALVLIAAIDGHDVVVPQPVQPVAPVEIG